MVQFNVEPIVNLGNNWIRIGDALYEKAQAMDGAVNGVGWTGPAGTAAKAAWHDGDRGVYTSLATSADAAWKIGESLHIYAEELQKTINEINKRRLVAALANIFGLVLGGLLMELGPLIGALLSAVRGILANMVPWFARLAAALAKTGAVGTFVTDAVIGAATNLGLDIITQLLANAAADEKFRVDWKSSAASVAFGAQQAVVGNHWTPHPKRSGAAESALPTVPKGAPTGAGAALNTPKPSVVLPLSGTKVPVPDFLTHAATLPPYSSPSRSTASESGLTGPQGRPASLNPVAAASAGPSRTGTPNTAPAASGAGPQPHLTGRPADGPAPTRPDSSAPTPIDPARSVPTGSTSTPGPTRPTQPGQTRPTSAGPAETAGPTQLTPSGPTGAPGPTRPTSAGPAETSGPAPLTHSAPGGSPGATRPTSAGSAEAAGPARASGASASSASGGGPAASFPGKGNTLGAAPGARPNPADNGTTTVNIPPRGADPAHSSGSGTSATTPAPVPPRRTGSGYDRPADLSTIANRPDSGPFPGSGNALGTTPGARPNPADNQLTTVNIPPTASRTPSSTPAATNTPPGTAGTTFPGNGNTLGTTPAARPNPADNQLTTVNIPPTASRTPSSTPAATNTPPGTAGTTFPGNGNTLGTTPAARPNPADGRPTTVNIPPTGKSTSASAAPVPPHRTGAGYDRPADLSTITDRPDSGPFPGTGDTLGATPGSRTNPADGRPTTVNIPPAGSKTPTSEPFPGTGNRLGAAPAARPNPADNEPTTVNVPPTAAGPSAGKGTPARPDVGHRRPATLDDLGIRGSGDGAGGAGHGTTLNQGSRTTTQVIHERPHASSDPAPVTASRGGEPDPAPATPSRGDRPDTAPVATPSHSNKPDVARTSTPHGDGPDTTPVTTPHVKEPDPAPATTAHSSEPDAAHTPAPAPAPGRPSQGAAHEPGPLPSPGGRPAGHGGGPDEAAAGSPQPPAAPSTQPAPHADQPSVDPDRSTPHSDRLDIDAARATIGDPSVPPDTLVQATAQAAAILSVRWHQVQPGADPWGAAPLVPRPESGPIGTGWTRALDLVTAQVVRHGPFTGQATAASVLPGVVAGSGNGPLLLLGETGPTGEALHLGAHQVPLAELSNWLPEHTGWQPGDLLVLPAPDAAVPGPQGEPSLAQRIADHTGAPVLAPDGDLYVSGDGRLVTDGQQGWIESLPHQTPVVHHPELGQSLFAHGSPPSDVQPADTPQPHAATDSGVHPAEDVVAAPAHQVTLESLLPEGSLDLDLTPHLVDALAEAAVHSLRSQLDTLTGPLEREVRFTAPADSTQLAKVLQVTQHVAGTLDQSIPVVRDTDGSLLLKICPPTE
ncbi:hypothetical protein C6Y14_12525 [Streptomyces dioscori]|uniref:Uncharacterized protein n=1 Tax=Streptomyces dioscori TaxID=2109333 RepID=A0A2P8Q9T1_9ACTN|nr:hypothetical protein [Streptomyces dioscori]PSM42994.1 hypothetical protein C6Y14_12525 [Streptomyces dioscori]